MKKTVSVLLIVLSVLTIFSPILAKTNQTMPMSELQLSSTVGGEPVADCTAFLLACGALAGGNPWLVALCIMAAGVCIIA